MARPPRTRVLALALGLTLLGPGGCGSDEPEQPPIYLDGNGGPWLDGLKWPTPDYGPFPDFGPFPDSKGPATDAGPQDSGGSDGPLSPDSGACPGPTGAKCSPACGSSQLCTAASGGTCAKLYTLAGAASKPKAMVQIALAYVECWNKQPKSDTLCATFDTCTMTGSLTHNMVKNWVCNQSQVTDFPNATVHNLAKQVNGCGLTNITRPDWKINSIQGGVRGKVCLTYDSISWWPDKLHVNTCKAFPPK